MSAHEAAELIRSKTTEGYPQVLARYGFAYANGWRTGRERAAEAIDTDQEGSK